MKKTGYVLLMFLLAVACSKTDVSPEKDTKVERPCGTYKSGQRLYTGPEGGCYYYNSNGNKTYVERGACNC